jgi:glutathione S-transferase
VKRQLDVLDRRLAEANISRQRLHDRRHRGVAVVRRLAKGLLYGAGEFLAVQDYKNVQRWTDAIAARPAVKRGRMVNRTGATRRASCTNATTPAISISGRRTSWRHGPGAAGA